MTRPTVDVLRLLLAAPEGDALWGAKISELTDLGKSTVSQILTRLSALGWVTLRQEEGPHPGRPGRVFPSMSPRGRRQAEAALAARAARGPHRSATPVMPVTPTVPSPQPVEHARHGAASRQANIEQAAHHVPDGQHASRESNTPPASPKKTGYWPIRWPSPEATPNEDVGTGPDVPLHGAADIPQHLAPLTTALTTLEAVNQSLTQDVFARAAAGPTHAEHYEKLIRSIVMKSDDLRRATLRAPRARSARPRDR